VQSKHDGKDYGVMKVTAGKFYGDAEADKGNIFFSEIILT